MSVSGRFLWQSATIVEVYSFKTLLHCLLLAWVFRGLLGTHGRPLRNGCITGVVLGLCLSHHLQFMFSLPGLFLLLVFQPEGRNPVFLVSAVLVTIATTIGWYGLLPLLGAKGGTAVWGDMGSFHGLLAHITGKEYRGFMFSVDLVSWFTKWTAIPLLLAANWTWIAVPLSAGILVGLLASCFHAGNGSRNRVFLFSWLVLILVPSGLNLQYSIPDVEIYFNDVFVSFSLVFSVAAGWLWNRLQGGRGGKPAALGVLGVILVGATIGINIPGRFTEFRLARAPEPAFLRTNSMARSLQESRRMAFVRGGGFMFLLRYSCHLVDPLLESRVFSLDLARLRWYRERFRDRLAGEGFSPLPERDEELSPKEIDDWARNAWASFPERIAFAAPLEPRDALPRDVTLKGGWFVRESPASSSWVPATFVTFAPASTRSRDFPAFAGWQPCIVKCQTGQVFDLRSDSTEPGGPKLLMATSPLEISFPEPVSELSFLAIRTGSGPCRLGLSSPDLASGANLPDLSFPFQDDLIDDQSASMTLGAIPPVDLALGKRISAGKLEITLSDGAPLMVLGIAGKP